MSRISFVSNSADETFEYAKKLAEKLPGGSVILLSGDLGVGKTVFAKGFAKGLGIDAPVTSPTFTIMQVYDSGRLPLYHFDVYRITDEDEMYEVGFEDYIYGDGISLIEWPEKIEGLVPKDAIKVTISKDLTKGIDYRNIEVTGNELDLGN